MCKTLSVETIPKVWNRVETVISKENTERNPHVMAPALVMMRDDQDKEITQLCEVEHIRIQEALQRGNLRLRELEKDRVRLRKKSIWMDADIKRLENEIVQACFVDKPRMEKQYTDNHTTALEDCH